MPDNTTRGAAALAGRMLNERYRLVRPIASGGMAEVWEADDAVLHRRVAVKILHPHLAGDATFLERFRVEARTAARLSHPGIVSIFDTASEDDVEAIIMELLEGIDLRSFLDDQGPLPPELTTEIGVQVSDALQAAHGAELVHRDIKPANIMLVDDRRVKVTDFGIAKPTQGRDLTEAGTLIGTAKYLAPEQVEGASVDGRADVYALGVVLFECLTGEVPFRGDNDIATAVARLRTDPPRVRQYRTTVPPELDAVIDRALARDPDARWASAADLRAALLAAPDATALDVAIEPDIPTQPEPPQQFIRRERRWLVPIVLIVVVAVALSVAGALIGSTEVGQDFVDRAREAVGLETEDTSTGPGPAEQDDSTTPGDDPSLAIVGVSTFDPEGSGEPGENDERIDLIVDGDRATSWATEGYDTRAFGGLKSGVGVILELSESTDLAALEVRGPTTGWAASVHVTDEVGDDLDAWGPPVVSAGTINEAVRFELEGRSGQAVLLWITDLGDGDPRVRVEIAEIEVFPA